MKKKNWQKKFFLIIVTREIQCKNCGKKLRKLTDKQSSSKIVYQKIETCFMKHIKICCIKKTTKLWSKD